MTIKTDSHGGRNYIVVNAECPKTVRPKVKLIGSMYVGEDGKEYLPELFDKFFGTIRSKIKGKYFKGELIGNNWVS